MIVLSQVSKSYGQKRALLPTSLTIHERETVALLGPSGSGKSTILRVVLGLLVPDQGTVTVGGVRVEPKSAPSVRLGMGYVIQDGGLFPHLTARENAAIVARQIGWGAPRIASRIAELTELVGLPLEALSRYPAELSGGEKQRVGIMRALMLDPPVLLLDEPLGALDPIIRARLQDDLRQIFARLAKTVILVTHDLDEAAFLSDEIALLHDGALVQRGPFRELASHPTDPFVSEFLQAQRPRAPREGA
ncbi:MAG TPA: ATP-binding cassette domain-containing protein [Polyangiaceae bacterium]|nr:ATP-binding cassette domain-containing protein [Polyangiaceae bacterium]